MAPRKGQTLNAEAARWLAKLQREDVTPADRAELERWLDADPAHTVAFARTESAWERAERLRARPRSMRVVAAARSWSCGRWAAVAATLAAVVLGAGLFWTHWNSGIHTTDIGEQRTVSLEDGSRISLNTATRIEVGFARDRRTVRLVNGEALFEVARDESRPFFVEASGAVIRAVGTAFNVRLRDRVVEVMVTEGVVAVTETRAMIDEKREASRVAAGSSVVVTPEAVTAVALDMDAMQRRLAWRDGVIELKGETLEEAVEEFNRYRSAQLVVADSRIAAIRVGGRFENDEADKFLNAVKDSFPIRLVEGRDGTIYLLQAE